MKVVVTGATGFVGREVLAQCIAHHRISNVIVLSRRAIDDNLSKNPKIQVIIHEDFSSYPSSLMKQLKGAEACIW
jgi:uncharacterized protein YbjT (DUF2867 family)